MNRDVSHLPLVSVIVPTWNHGKELIHCLSSLEKQTYRPFEVIVVDDGSTDQTDVLLKGERYSFPFQYIQLDHNKGASYARNLGARRAKGSLLLFVDADATLRPHAIKRMVTELLKHRDATFVYSSFRFGWKRFRSRVFDPQILRKMPFIHTTALLRKEAFPGFDESLQKFQDWDLWLTIADRGGIGLWIPEELFVITVRSEGMSKWLPSFFHKIPWNWLGWMPGEMKKYRYWEDIVKKKHGIVHE